MGIEQLKLILETLQNVSGGAQLVAILWVCKGYFIAVIIAIALIIALKSILSLIRYVTDADERKEKLLNFAKEITERRYPDEAYLAQVKRWIELGKRSEVK